LVRRVERAMNTAIIESADGRTETVAATADREGEAALWSRPARDWPSAALPLRGGGRLVAVRRGPAGLRRLLEWVKLDDFQIGGALYLNPELRLSFGDRLTAVYSASASSTRLTALPIEIPRNFSPLAVKQAAVAAATIQPEVKKPEPPKTLFSLLKEDD
jgi:hypothetical protein